MQISDLEYVEYEDKSCSVQGGYNVTALFSLVTTATSTKAITATSLSAAVFVNGNPFPLPNPVSNQFTLFLIATQAVFSGSINGIPILGGNNPIPTV